MVRVVTPVDGVTALIMAEPARRYIIVVEPPPDTIHIDPGYFSQIYLREHFSFPLLTPLSHQQNSFDHEDGY
jgi:hypothetical protein